jgi:hypothetical protein
MVRIKFLQSSRHFGALVMVTVLALVQVSCFKENFPKVGAPEDVAPGDTTSAPIIKSNGKKVLLIAINGCRGDVMRGATIPNIKGLLPHAVYSFDALTQAPTLSGPGWASMLTGVWGGKHGVTNDTYSQSNFVQYPMIYKYIKTLNPSLRTVAVCATPAINEQLVTNADVKITADNNDVAVKDSAIFRLKNDNPDLMVVNFNGPDNAGNQYGYDAAVSEYTNAITTADQYVGEVLEALNSRSNIATEDWLVIITTDHGGNANGHGGSSYAEQNIFTVFYNKNFLSREVVPPVNTLKATKYQSIGEYAYVDDAALNFDNYPQFTIQFEIRSPEMKNSNGPVLIGNKDWNSGRNIGWVVYAYGPIVGFNAGDGAGNRFDIDATDAPHLDDNLWHHVTVTVDRAGDARLYQDGKLYKSASMLRISKLNPNTRIKLVIDDDITETFGSRYGNAEISMTNIRLWKTVLSEETIKNYSLCDTTITAAHPNYADLVAWWKGTDGSGNTIKDYGPHQFDMKLKGNPLWEEQQIDLCNKPLPPTVPTMVDIAPGILNWLKINVDAGWRMDGRSWLP